ncbi:hypothetical protein GLOIN_2v1778046 [Rhizophagus irregularis DAOM 181602=DAOM 197198]|nr:hypothetical protein GLOIN_2v1778046 [Rhizophagus irregularis DAOM 181602=DAOM 197198]
MVGIPHLYFDWNDSIPDFLVQLRLNLQNWGIDPNDNIADPPIRRDNAIGHLRVYWRIAGGHSTNAPVNALNANAGNTVVVAGIRFGQAFEKAENIGEHLPLDELVKKLYEIELR